MYVPLPRSAAFSLVLQYNSVIFFVLVDTNFSMSKATAKTQANGKIMEHPPERDGGKHSDDRSSKNEPPAVQTPCDFKIRSKNQQKQNAVVRASSSSSSLGLDS